MFKNTDLNFQNGFYIWFSKELKKEFYTTPLYSYLNTRKENTDTEYTLSLSTKKTKNREVSQFITNFSLPYTERLGMFLINFLNTDFTNAENSYKTFFYIYGFELLKDYSNFKIQYSDEKEFLKEYNIFFSKCSHYLIDLQSKYRQAINFIYNINTTDELKDYKYFSKFTAYFINNNDVTADSECFEIILDNFIEKHHKLKELSLTDLLTMAENNVRELKLANIYTTDTLRGMCYLVLKKLVVDENITIKQCENCNRYFIPVNRQAEIYCDLPNLDNTPTCREKGARLTYKNNLENIEGLLEYRRTYQKKLMEVSRNKENTKLKSDFDKWKKSAQAKIKDFKKDLVTEKELYNWMIQNK